MINNNYKKNKINYFKLDDKQIIYAANTWKRALAKFIDIFLIIIVSRIIVSTSFIEPTQIAIEATTVSNWNTQIIPFLPDDKWNIISSSLIISFSFMYLIAIPMLNFKNFGQSLGKMILRITPLYLNERKNYLSFLYKETPLFILIIIPSIFRLSAGIDYMIYYQTFQRLTSGISSELGSTNIYRFLNEFVILIPGISSSSASLSLGAHIMSLIVFSILMLNWIFLAFKTDKRGIFDLLPNISVVDLKTVIMLTEANSIAKKIELLDKQSEIPQNQHQPGPNWNTNTSNSQQNHQSGYPTPNNNPNNNTNQNQQGFPTPNNNTNQNNQEFPTSNSESKHSTTSKQKTNKSSDVKNPSYVVPKNNDNNTNKSEINNSDDKKTKS